MFVRRKDWEALQRRVEALEAAVQPDKRTAQRQKEEELSKQWDNFWSYDGTVQEGARQ